MFEDWGKAKDNKVVVANTWEKVNSFMSEEWKTTDKIVLRKRDRTQSKLW